MAHRPDHATRLFDSWPHGPEYAILFSNRWPHGSQHATLLSDSWPRGLTCRDLFAAPPQRYKDMDTTCSYEIRHKLKIELNLSPVQNLVRARISWLLS